MKKIEQKTTTLTKIVVASCVLHNICIESGDLFDDGCDDEDENRLVLGTGNDVRDALKDFVQDNL